MSFHNGCALSFLRHVLVKHNDNWIVVHLTRGSGVDEQVNIGSAFGYDVVTDHGHFSLHRDGSSSV